MRFERLYYTKREKRRFFYVALTCELIVLMVGVGEAIGCRGGGMEKVELDGICVQYGMLFCMFSYTAALHATFYVFCFFLLVYFRPSVGA